MAVQVDIFVKDMDLTDRIREYVTKKVSKLDRYMNGIEQVRVDLAYVKSVRSAKDRQVAQITVRGPRVILRSEERNADMLTAFDMALDKIQRRIERYKGKRFRGRGDGTSLGELVAEQELALLEEESEPVIARRKRFVLIPMDEMEAIEQMELLGHEDFFIFYNANTNAVNVLYRRRDGSYGLIETEIG